MTKIHVLKDEMLGGVKREYVEVERRAKEGERVVISNGHKPAIRGGYYENGDIFIANKNDVDDILSLVGTTIRLFHKEYRVLEPSDIVIIGGKRYRIEERLAEPGELILNKSNGLTYDVKDVAGDFITVGDSQLMLEEDYVVLKRIDAPQSQDDIIANLVRRVSDLERKNERLETELTDAKNDIETWAQEVETLKHDKEPKQITLDIDTLAKLLGGVRG